MATGSECEKCGGRGDADSSMCAECRSVYIDVTLPPTSNPPVNSEDMTVAPDSSESTNSRASLPFVKRPGGQIAGEFGEYELLEEIARGGMGVVYQARHNQLNRVVALKMILGGQFTSEADRQRFRIEAEAAAGLDHPGIVPVYEFGEENDQAFLAMKYVDGGSLSDVMDGCREDPRMGVELLCKVSRAIHFAHTRAILHRDLKPANILVDSSGSPLVTDFGLAKKTEADSNLTATGAVLGTPKYMAPEQAAGKESVTTAVDIYALGAILYEILTGQAPHSGATAVETLMSVIANEPDAPSKLNNRVDRELELICNKAIAREPAQRYSSAAALADDLENWLHGESISIKAPSFGVQIQRWLKRNRRLAYVMFAALVGTFLAIPILVNIFTGGDSSIGDVYQHFPDKSKPYIYRFSRMPAWADDIFMSVLFFVVWPGVGFLNALVTRPKKLYDALYVGFLTSASCAAAAFLLLGWFFFMVQAAHYSTPKINALANATWPSAAGADESRQSANKMFEGLEEVPVEDRAQVVVDRIAGDQIAIGPIILMWILIACCGLAIPVLYGTVFGHLLLQRKIPIWLAIVRYEIAWVAISMAVFAIAIGAMAETSPSTGVGLTISIVCVVGAFFAFLAMRRWKRNTPVESA